MELRRIYDENFEYCGYLKDRAVPLEADEYVLVAGVILFSEGKFLATKRAENKEYPHKWEFTVGSVVREESALEGALRELSEEVGVKATGEELRFLGTMKETQKFSKIFLLEKTVETITLQKSEVEDYKWIDKSELDAMLEANEFAEPMAARLRKYLPMIEDCFGA